MKSDFDVLRDHGVQPSAQRLAVAAYVLHTDEHPSAEDVWTKVRDRLPMISRATVYNTLNLFVRKGLLRSLALAEGHVVFDRNIEPHHHAIDERSGRIYDVPWDAVSVTGIENIPGFRVHAYQVVMRGEAEKRAAPRRRRRAGAYRTITEE